MRRLLPLLLTLVLLPSVALGASWRHLSSHSLGVSLSYPPTWQLSTIPHQITLQHSGRRIYSLTMTLTPVKPARSSAGTVLRVVAYARASGDPGLATVRRWTSTSMGGYRTLAGIVRPSTEGGVALAEGVYIVAVRSRVYEITIVSYSRPRPASLDRFPTVYRQILQTLRFHA